MKKRWNPTEKEELEITRGLARNMGVRGVEAMTLEGLNKAICGQPVIVWVADGKTNLAGMTTAEMVEWHRERRYSEAEIEAWLAMDDEERKHG